MELKQLLILFSAMGVWLGSPMAATAQQIIAPQSARLTFSNVRMADGSNLPQGGIKALCSDGALRARFVTPFSAAPLRTAAEPGALYGYLGQNYANEAYGLKLISRLDGAYTTVWDDTHLDENMSQMMVCGWLYQGRVCGFSPITIASGVIAAIDYLEFDFETGQLISSERLSADFGKLLMTAAYNESDGYVYGYGATSTGMAFMKAPVTDPTALAEVKVIQNDDEICQSLTYNPVDKALYGVTLGGQFVKVDRFGSQEQKFSLESVNAIDCMTGLAYSVADDLYYWNALDGNYASNFYSISTVRKSATQLGEYNGAEQFMFYIAANETYYADAPARGSFRSSTFADGSDSGEVSFTLPTELNNGEAIGQGVKLSWTISADGVKRSEGTAAPGAIVKCAFSGLSTGMHTFAMQSAIGDRTSISTPVSLYIGNDQPSVPANVLLSDDGLVSWDAVTTGANGGYVDASAMTYSVTIGGVGSQTTTGTSCRFTLPADAPLAAYVATVQAECNSMVSGIGISNSVVAGRPLSLDVYIAPSLTESELFSMADCNADAEGWTFMPFDTDGACFWSGFSRTQRMDDWLFLPPVNFDDPTAFYSFEMLAKYMDINYPDEFVEVRFGSQPDAAAMTGEIMEATRITEPDYVTFGGKFKVSEAGTYYIGIHCMSMADMYGVMVREFRVSKSAISGQSPAAVENLTVRMIDYVPTVSFTMPAVTMDGTAIDASTEITATITGASTVTVKGAPGSEQAATVAVNDGLTRISVTTSIGELQGDVAWATFKSGESIPAPVDNLTATVGQGMLDVTLNWLAPIQDVNNNTIDSENVSYNIYYRDMSNQSWQLMASDLRQTSYHHSIASNSAQMLMEFGVQAQNDAGVNNKMSVASCVLGQPVHIPMTEDYDNLNRVQQGYVMESSSAMSTNWTFLAYNFVPDCPTQRGYVLACDGDYAGQSAMMWLPAFSTSGAAEASLTVTVWTGGANTSIMYQAYGMDKPRELVYVERNGSWRTFAVDLPAEACDKGWVRLAISCDFDDYGSLFAMDSYSLSPMSSVADASADRRGAVITTDGSSITVANCEGAVVAVASADGRMVGRTANAAGSVTFGNLAAGVYVVTVDGAATKIVI